MIHVRFAVKPLLLTHGQKKSLSVDLYGSFDGLMSQLNNIENVDINGK